MKLKSLTIENFRGYKDKTTIQFDDLTTFVGANDIGKSTVLEALEIFFNNDMIKIESNDANINSESKIVSISCDFICLPPNVVLDSGEQTNLADEYLVIEDDTLRIKKVFDCGKQKVSEDIFIVAKHPNKDKVSELLSLKEKDLQKMVKEIVGDEGPQKGNPKMRKSIWGAYTPDELCIKEKEICVSKSKDDAKEIWSKIESYLPAYALFRSDRSSSDSDNEVQNPMKAAIQEAIKEVQDDITAIENKVREKAVEIANNTHDVLKTIDANLANQLTPKFTPPATSKWNSLFSIAMDTDEGIPLNKRGSGVRRMILVAFFKAEAERKSKISNKKDIIYAIEEPETAQHPNSQKILLDSFLELSRTDNCQVIMTTHSPSLASEIPTDSLRFITKDDTLKTVIKSGDSSILKEIAKTLGVFAKPHMTVKILICVEGPTDVIALKAFSRCLREKYDDIIDLDTDERIAILPLGGSNLKYWVELDYLKNIGCPQVHIYDNDVQQYQKSIDEINSRKDGSWGTLTKKYEIENYLHKDAIQKIYEVDVDTDCEGVPRLFGQAFSKKQNFDGIMKDKTSKTYLSKVFNEGMTYDLLIQRDKDGEIKGWFNKIKTLVEQ